MRIDHEKYSTAAHLALTLCGLMLGGCIENILQNTDGNQADSGQGMSLPSWSEGTTEEPEASMGSSGFATSSATTEAITTIDDTGQLSTSTGNDTASGTDTTSNAETGSGAGTNSSEETGFGGDNTSSGDTSSGDVTGSDDTGEPSLPDGGVAVSVVTGNDLTCLLLDTDRVRCWGYGQWGQHGLGNTGTWGDTETPDTVPDVQVGFDVKQVVAGDQFACALSRIGGKVRCWGRGTHGVLGTGSLATIGDDEHPSDAPEVKLNWPAVELAAGSTHMCALGAAGGVACWGQALEGQLGYGNKKNIGDDEVPASAGDVPVGGPVAHIFAGSSTTCAILKSGESRCWGRGGTHGNGTGVIGDDETPASVKVLALPWPVEQFASGGSYTCARAGAGNGGEVRCFGDPALYPNGFGQGQLGYGNLDPIWTSDQSPPVELEWPAVEITAFTWHTCARSSLGLVKCWGTGGWGRLGYGNQANIGDDETPADVGDVLLGFTADQVSAGGYHTCSLYNAGKLRCWGWNGQGALGIGSAGLIGDDEEPFFGPDTPY